MYGGAFTPPVAPFLPADPSAGPTNASVTQVAAEHWLTTNPDTQITQVALEHWATVTGTAGTQLAVTQIALEHWASVAIQAGGPIITMIG